MFNFDGASKGVVLENVTFNFDSSDFSALVHESDASLAGRVELYRGLMQETLTESSGALNENTVLIMENAIGDVGTKIVKILIAVKNWLLKTIQRIVLNIQTLATSNKKLLGSIKTSVEEKLKNGSLAKLKAEMLDYDLGAISVEAIIGKWDELYKGPNYDLRGDYTAANKEAMDLSVKNVNEANRNDIVMRAIGQMYKGSAKTTAEVPMEARKLLRKGGDRKVVSFDMKYFSIVENFESTKEPIQKSFNGLVAEVDVLIKEINANVKTTKTEGKDDSADKAFTSGKVAFYSAKRKILTLSLDAAVLLNNLKLQAAVEQMQEAKKFCVQASRHKVTETALALKESVEPYAPHLDFEGITESAEPAASFVW
jgi:hypothetical protein